MGLCLAEIAGATQDSDAWYNKGSAVDNLSKYEEAIKAYDQAIEINPHDFFFLGTEKVILYMD